MRTLNPRVFWLVLLTTALIGLIIRVEIGMKSFISFDEWQHAFMASSARWADLAFELRTNAHPPLFFLLLGVIVKWGSVEFYRSISIAAGVGSIVLIGLIARRILASPILPLVCAAVFALSTDAISVSVEVRSYQLMIFFVLLAFWAWQQMLATPSQPAGIGYCCLFAIASSLAVLTHYSTAFFIGACVVVSAMFLRKSGVRVALALAAPCVVFAAGYFMHARTLPMEGYLFDFYRSTTPGEALPHFLLRNFRNFFNLFSPVQVRGTGLALLVILLLCLTAFWSFRKSSGEPRKVAIIFPAVIVLELLAASLLDKYPFGGMLRHQYIAAPFLLLAAFAVLDVVLDAFPLPPYQYAIPALILTASVANVVMYGPKLIWFPGVVLVSKEFNSWRSAFPGPRAVYVDHWGVIGFFIHTNDQPRTFLRSIPAEAEIDEYRLPDGTKIFYDKTRFQLDLSDPSLYSSFADCIRNAGVKELTVFFYSAGDRPINQPPGALEATVTRKAAEQGLTATRIVVTPTSLAAGFELR